MPDKKAERPEGQMRRRPMRRRKKVLRILCRCQQGIRL